MSVKRSLVVITFFLLVCVNCLGIKPGLKERREKDRRTQAEKSFDPWKIEKENPIVVQEGSAEAQEEFSPGMWEKDEASGTSADHETFYLIQIFASKFPEEARSLADSVESCFGKRTRIDYEIPYYKVRLGDFDTLEKAESFLRLIRKSGFPQAWVVKTRKEEREEDD